jgi:hypothetical protein
VIGIAASLLAAALDAMLKEAPRHEIMAPASAPEPTGRAIGEPGA